MINKVLLISLKLVLAEMNYIPAYGSNIDAKELHLARKLISFFVARFK